MATTKSMSIKEKIAGLRMEWVLGEYSSTTGMAKKWDLMYGVSSKTGKRRSIATVWDNGVWITWDRNGVGGENWQEDSIDNAKDEAKKSAIAQGFV